jgi:hypothetical protein
MTLKEKFNEAFVSEARFDSENAVQIADEFAIGFAEWCIERDEHYPVQAGRITVKELLEIYKTEQNL